MNIVWKQNEIRLEVGQGQCDNMVEILQKQIGKTAERGMKIGQKYVKNTAENDENWPKEG